MQQLQTRYFNPQQSAWYGRRLREMNGRLKVMEVGGTDEKGRPLGIPSVSGQSTEDLEKEILRIQQQIKIHTPPKRNANTKNRLYKEARELLSQIMTGMPSHGDMWGRKTEGDRSQIMDDFEFNEVVHKHGNWEKRNLSKIKEFRNIMRQLDIDNPLVGSTAFIRRCKSVDDFFNKIKQN